MSRLTWRNAAPRAWSERLAHARLDPDPVDLAHREDLRVELLQQLALALVERAHADERELPGLDRRQLPVVVGERVAGEAERRREHHAVHVSTRRRLGSVEVAVRVDPDDAARAVHRRHADERAERDRVVAAEHERQLVRPPRVGDELRHAIAELEDRLRGTALVSPTSVDSATGASTLPKSPVEIPSFSARCSARPAYRIADGPMSTPRRPAPRSSGTPIRATCRSAGCTLTAARLTSSRWWTSRKGRLRLRFESSWRTTTTPSSTRCSR